MSGMKAIIQEGLDDYLYDLYYSQCPPGLRAGNEGFEGYPAHSGESEFTGRPWFLVSETDEGASGREVQPSYDTAWGAAPCPNPKSFRFYIKG